MIVSQELKGSLLRNQLNQNRKFYELYKRSLIIFVTINSLRFRLSDSLSVLIDGLEFKSKDILTFLSRPLPSLSRIDLSSYRDSDLWSDYSRGADSIVFSDISDVGPGSIRSELSLNFSEITNNNYQTVPVIRDRKGSGTSSVTSERLRASAEINRSSTGVLNRLAYNLIGDSRGRTPSGSTTGTT